jgi:hypothetical protein
MLAGEHARPVTRQERLVALVLTSLVVAVATLSFPAAPAAAAGRITTAAPSSAAAARHS